MGRTSRVFGFLGMALAVVWVVPATADPMTLEYLGRYNAQAGRNDEIVNGLSISGNRAIAVSNKGLALVDLATLPPEGTEGFLDRLTGINGRDVYTVNDEYFYVNAHRD